MTKIVFTNGCFDVLHPGHIELLRQARALGERLIVGINSDKSVKSIKGPDRPVFGEKERKAHLLSLRFVDEVFIFDELTPKDLITRLKPNVLVKGGDWQVDEIVGGDFVRSIGGEVVSIPLVEGFSSTKVVQTRNNKKAPTLSRKDDVVRDSLSEHLITFENVLDSLTESVRETGETIIETFRTGNKVLVCGNGGSAADAQHLAAEFVGRYESERRSLPAIALTTDTSALTAIGNDFGFERVFARQVESLASDGDCLIAISTSGNSPNVVAAVMVARQRGCRIIGLTGATGKKLASISDLAVLAPATRTARIQEVHITVAHIWCEMVDLAFAAE